MRARRAASLVELPFEQLLETEVIGASAFVREVTDAPSAVTVVEYAPGPGAAVYGNNVFLGVLHVITRKGRDMDGARLAITRGSHGDRKTRLNFGKRLDNGADLVLSLASHRASIPRRDDSDDPLPRVHDGPPVPQGSPGWMVAGGRLGQTRPVVVFVLLVH